MKKNTSKLSKEIIIKSIPGGIKVVKGTKVYVMSNSIPRTNAFFINKNVPSKKNNKSVMISKTTKKPILQLSKLYKKYEKNTASEFQNYLPSVLLALSLHQKPYNIALTFFRDSERIFDYFGPAETIADLMVKHGWIDDDNVHEVKFFFKDYVVSKEKPGVLIEILNDGNIFE